MSGQDDAAEAVHAQPVVELRLGVRQHARRSARREHDLRARARRERVARRRQDLRGHRPPRRAAADANRRRFPRSRDRRRPPAPRRPVQASPGRSRRRARAATTTRCGSIRRIRSSCCHGNDSGFRVSTDGGASWTRATSRRARSSTWRSTWTRRSACTGRCRITAAIARSSIVSQGVAAMKPVSFESAPGGEGSTHAIDPTNPNIVYSAGTYGDDHAHRSRRGAAGAGGRRGRGRRPADAAA